MEEKAKEEQQEKNEQQVKEVQTHVQMLIDIASDCSFFHDEQREGYAVISFEKHEETHRIRSRDFRLWLIRNFYDRCNGSPASDSVTRALQTLEAKALYNGDQFALSYRVAEDGGCFYYDLADQQWRVVKVNADGWELAEHPYKFKRAGNTASQVEPKPKGDLSRVLRYVNVRGFPEQILLQVYLVSCLIPNIPHPLLLLIGEKGAAKSTLTRIIKRLVDPSDEELLSLARDQNELGLQLAKNYMPAFDNLDGMQGWQSDMLAKAVTGGGITKRRLFTDEDEIILKFKRCVILNGINPAVTRSDLLDRTIPLVLERITKKDRREESEFWNAFEMDRPLIFGGMLDVLSKAIRIYPSVKINELPRMADFCRWGYAIAEAMGIKGETFLAMYWAAIEHQNEVAIDHHPVASAVRVLMQGKAYWDGSPSGLLGELEGIAVTEKIDTKSRSWPKAAHSLTKRLKEVKSNLEDIGITFTETRTGTSRVIMLNNMNQASQASLASPALYEHNDGMNGMESGASPEASLVSSEYNDSNDGNDTTFTTDNEGE